MSEPTLADLASLADPAVIADPYPLLAWFREASPFAQLDGALVVFGRYEDCSRILRDPRASSERARSRLVPPELQAQAQERTQVLPVARSAGSHQAQAPGRQGVHAAGSGDARAEDHPGHQRPADGGPGQRRRSARAGQPARLPAAGADHLRAARRAARGSLQVRRLVGQAGALGAAELRRDRPGRAGRRRAGRAGVRRVLHRADRRAAVPPGRRPADQADQGRGCRGPADRRRADRDLRAAAGGRPRDDRRADRQRDARPAAEPGPARRAGCRAAPRGRCRRGDPAIRPAGPAHRAGSPGAA